MSEDDQVENPGWRRRLASLRLDVTPLRGDRDFRILFAAGTVFYFGFMITYVALPFQLYHLTGSNFAVGALGLIELLPLIVCGLYGGALADHVDRRTMLVLTGVGQVLLTVGLLGNGNVAASAGLDHLCPRRAVGGRRVAAAAQPGGVAAAGGQPRAAAGGGGRVVVFWRTAVDVGRSGPGRHRDRAGRGAAGVRDRRGWADRRDRSFRGPAALPGH
nr:MFS transporter [Fodinicola feengrottensis]